MAKSFGELPGWKGTKMSKGNGNYEDAELCASCGGKCCKGLPGACWPSDFGSSATEIMLSVEKALRSGRYCFDWWEGDVRGSDRSEEEEFRYRSLFVRPAIKGEEGDFSVGAWNGQCTFLEENGCSLDHAARPHGCRHLEPRPVRCVVHDDAKRGSCIAWLPYHNLMEQLEDRLYEEIL